MAYETIKKELDFIPNLKTYRTNFDWREVEDSLDGLDGRKYLNIGHELADRHIGTANRDKVAMYWEGKNGEKESYTFHDLYINSNKTANMLSTLGIKKGDRVFTYMDRIPELYFCLLGILKAGGVMGPLFSAFGPDAIRDRMFDSEAKILITTPSLIKTVHEISRENLPALQKIIVINRRNTPYELQKDELDYEELIKNASKDFETVRTTKEDFAIIHYTSGTTGKPKGAAHAHQAVMGHMATAKYVLDLKSDDIYWCTADPGWVTGTSYGISGPWSNGVTQVIFEGGFSANGWYSIIERYKVTVWYSAPTAIRMLMKAGDAAVAKHDLSSLRYLCSVGEPLNPEAVVWSNRVFKRPFHDNWWQTETGCIQIANYPIQDIRPGSMGRPFPGVVAAILDEEYKNEVACGDEGNLALKVRWPSMFRTYWKKEELYNSRFKGEWYITGDRARRDEDGYFWFVGRADDVINTAGHLVGPFEVESALVEHPAVAEAGVIGIPDKLAMEVVKAFVSLRDGYTPSEELRDDIKRFAKKKLHALSAPREIEFLSGLPKTRSGKIMRRLLKARELGLPEGDTSTLEE